MEIKLYETVLGIQQELDLGLCSRQRKRNLEEQLDLLLAYQEAHPTQEETPNSFDLYCFENPEALECRVFDV